MSRLAIISHGKESGPNGEKIRSLGEIARSRGFNVLAPDYRGIESPEQRVVHLLNIQLPSYEKLVLVGSSMGGYVSTLASGSLTTDGLFLMAPAFYISGYENQDPKSSAEKTAIVHGWGDEVIPYRNSIRFADEHRCSLHLIDGDHRLSQQIKIIEKLFDEFLLQVIER